jgi:putative PEP-CTERM system TPR-repeat lipoprotein
MLLFKKPTTGQFFAAGLLSLSILLTGCGEDSNTAQDYSKNLKRGETYLQQGQYKAAIIEAKNAIQKAPQEASSHLLMARILLDIGQSRAALDQLSQVEANNNPDYLLTKAEALLAQRKYHSAEQLLESNQALLSASNQAQYLELAAQAQLGLPNIDKAESLLQQILKLDPTDPGAQVNLAMIAASKGDMPQAEQLLNNALTTNPDNTKALLFKAQLAKTKNDLEGAEDALTTALTSLSTTDIMTPQRASILSSLAEVLTQQGRSTEAMIYTRILAEAMPGQLELTNKFEEALSLLQTGDLDTAETLLEEILAEAPNHQSAGQILGIIKYNRGDLEAANSYFADTIDAETAPENATLAFAMTNLRLNNPERVLTLLDDQISNITNEQLLGLYGLAALSANQFDKGEFALKKALSINPQLSRLRLALASGYNNSNQPQLALQELQLAYQTTPADPFIQKAMVQQFLNLKQKDNADKFIATLAKDHPENANSLILVGTYQYVGGNTTAAITSLKKALSIDPANAEAFSSLGTLYIRTNKYSTATQHYRQMIKAIPTSTMGYKGLFTSLELEDKKQQAIEDVTAMAKTSSHIAPYAVLVEFYARNSNFTKANDLLTEAQKKYPQDSNLQQLTAQLALAEAQHAFKNKRLTLARQAIMKGLQDKPDDIRLQTLLVDTEIAEQNFREASKITEQLAVNNGNLAMLLRGNIATAEKKPGIALNHYQTLWTNQPSSDLAKRIYNNLNTQNKNEEAAEFLLKWETAFPNSPEMLSVKGSAAIIDQNYSAAIQDINKAIELQGKQPSPILLNNLAWAYLQTGNLSAAEENASQAFKMAPKSAAIADTYGWVMLKAGKRDEARKILKIAYDLAPDNAEIASHWKEASAL